MVNVKVHYRAGDEQRGLPAPPRPDDYIDGTGGFWTVAAVVFGTGGMDMYAVKLADNLADDCGGSGRPGSLHWPTRIAPVAFAAARSIFWTSQTSGPYKGC